MLINKIILRNRSLEGERTIVFFSDETQKPVNFFHMPNSSWKSLVFNALEHLFSYDKEKFIKDTDKSIWVEIYFNLNESKYLFKSDHGSPYRVYDEEWNELKNFEIILRNKIGLHSKQFEFLGKKRGSLKSLNRFAFFDFDWINDNEESNEISLIDSRFDFGVKKLIFAYILWAQIDEEKFEIIWEAEYRRAFIERNKKKFDKYTDSNQTKPMFDESTRNNYTDVQSDRVLLWDITVAIREISKFRREYLEEVWENEDYVLLGGELEKMNIELNECKKRLQQAETALREKLQYEKMMLSEIDPTLRFKGLQLSNYVRYIEYKKYLEGCNLLQIDSYILENLNPCISAFKKSMEEIYDIFIDNASKKGILKKDDLLESQNVIFNADTLKITAFFKTSEGMRESLRILTFIWIHIFALKNDTRCLNASFYDSFLEKIDSEIRSVLFDSIFEFIAIKDRCPNMYFFVTKVESDKDSDSILELKEKHWKYIQIIEWNWLKEII